MHNNINDDTLPISVRNKLFFHYFHYCAVLGCKHAPYKEIEKLVKTKSRFISFFPILSKGDISEMMEILKEYNSKYFNKNLEIFNTSVKSILSENNNFIKYASIKVGIAYLFAQELNGKRHKGNMDKIINGALTKEIEISSINLNEYEPLMIANKQNGRACLVSSALSFKNLNLVNNLTETNGYEVKLK